MDKKNEKLNVEVFDYSTIPKFMPEHGRFCLWKFVMKPGKTKPDKIPYRIDGKRADATNPQHYSSFDEIVEAFGNGGYAGMLWSSIFVTFVAKKIHWIVAWILPECSSNPFEHCIALGDSSLNSTNALEVNCDPWSECRINSPFRTGCDSNAFFRVRIARSLVICRSVILATTLRSCRSMVVQL